MDFDDVKKDIQSALVMSQKLELYFRFNESEEIEYDQAILLDTEEGPVLRVPCWWPLDAVTQSANRDIPLSLLALSLEDLRLHLQEEQRIREQKLRDERQARKEKAKQKAAAKKARQALQKEEEERLKLKELLKKYGSPQ